MEEIEETANQGDGDIEPYNIAVGENIIFEDEENKDSAANRKFEEGMKKRKIRNFNMGSEEEDSLVERIKKRR